MQGGQSRTMLGKSLLAFCVLLLLPDAISLQKRDRPIEAKSSSSAKTQQKFGYGNPATKLPLDVHESVFDPPVSMRKQMNLSVNPCDDFYEFACGNFEATVHIPEDMGGFARSWDGGSAKIYKEMRQVLENDQGKAGNWYKSCMMVDYINDQGAKPLQPYLKQIANIQTYQDMWLIMAQFQFWDVPAFFDWWVGADNLEPSEMNLYFGSGGLILPDQTYYTMDTDEMRSHRSAYREYIVTQLKLAGLSQKEAESDADQCLEIETELAIYQRLEPYVPLKQSFNHINQSELIEMLPNIDFRLMFDKLSISDVGTDRKNIVLKAPEFYQRLSDFFGRRSPKSLIPYVRWHLVYNLSPLLSKEFLAATLKVDANLMGISQQPERWHKCVAATKSALPMIVDKLFIDNFFSSKDREVAVTMLQYIKAAFKLDLETVQWMTEASREAALEKLDNIFFECGHPDHWEVCDWDVSNSSYFDNSLVSCAARKARKLARLKQPADRHRWSMSVMSVNSYYDNAVNGLFITAGMLQRPFFDAAYDMARNFGGVGAIMGHELTHGFDNTGRKYDPHSRLRDWWDRETVEEFETRAQCIARLYDGFQVVGTHVRGNRTLGENIADAGGIKSAYGAWHMWYTDDRCREVDQHEMPMTHELCRRAAHPPRAQRQLFWVAYGQNWCDKEREQSLKLSVQTDEHAPDMFRVNGPLSQSPDFARDWQCPVGSRMNPKEKCSLW